MAARRARCRGGESDLQTYVAAAYRGTLEAHHLGDFDALWRYQGAWFEPPNQGRGGWSGVNRLELARPEGKPLVLFLKRQQNYTRRTWRHPVRGVATFAREYANIRHLAARGVPVPTLVYFASRIDGRDRQAILLTEELTGYRALEHIAGEVLASPQYSLRQKRKVIASVADAVRAMHRARLQHRALHAKHLLVNMAQPEAPRTVIIDFEKARIRRFFLLRGLRDLSTLNRNLHGPGRTARLYFFKRYLGVERLGFCARLLCRLLLRRDRGRSRGAA